MPSYFNVIVFLIILTVLLLFILHNVDKFPLFSDSRLGFFSILIMIFFFSSLSISVIYFHKSLSLLFSLCLSLSLSLLHSLYLSISIVFVSFFFFLKPLSFPIPLALLIHTLYPIHLIPQRLVFNYSSSYVSSLRHFYSSLSLFPHYLYSPFQSTLSASLCFSLIHPSFV